MKTTNTLISTFLAILLSSCWSTPAPDICEPTPKRKEGEEPAIDDISALDHCAAGPLKLVALFGDKGFVADNHTRTILRLSAGDRSPVFVDADRLANVAFSLSADGATIKGARDGVFDGRTGDNGFADVALLFPKPGPVTIRAKSTAADELGETLLLFDVERAPLAALSVEGPTRLTANADATVVIRGFLGDDVPAVGGEVVEVVGDEGDVELDVNNARATLDASGTATVIVRPRAVPSFVDKTATLHVSTTIGAATAVDATRTFPVDEVTRPAVALVVSATPTPVATGGAVNVVVRAFADEALDEPAVSGGAVSVCLDGAQIANAVLDAAGRAEVSVRAPLVDVDTDVKFGGCIGAGACDDLAAACADQVIRVTPARVDDLIVTGPRHPVVGVAATVVVAGFVDDTFVAPAGAGQPVTVCSIPIAELLPIDTVILGDGGRGTFSFTADQANVDDATTIFACPFGAACGGATCASYEVEAIVAAPTTPTPPTTPDPETRFVIAGPGRLVAGSETDFTVAGFVDDALTAPAPEHQPVTVCSDSADVNVAQQTLFLGEDGRVTSKVAAPPTAGPVDVNVYACPFAAPCPPATPTDCHSFHIGEILPP